MNDELLKLRSILKTMSINDNQINNILRYENFKTENIKDVIKQSINLQHEDTISYGVEKDFRIFTTEWNRIGNLTFHRDLPIHNLMKGVLLDDNGNIIEYLPEDDWSNVPRDGSRGQVMVEIPKHYRRFYTKDEGNILGVRISLFPIEGYHEVPRMFIGAYEASLDRVNKKLASVVNTTDNFRGGDNQSDWDNTYKSLLGLPVTNISCNSLQEFARNRGSANWNIYMYECHKTLLWLYIIEYANSNCQLEYTSELTENGYKQGGLGSGLTGISNSNWKKYNSQYPIIPCGYTDNFGNNTGMKTIEVNIPEIETPIIQEIPRYRGIENIFGHLWKYIIGLNLKISADVNKGGDGTTKVYSCNNPLKFNNNDLKYYKYIGNTVRASSYVKTIIFGDDGCYLASSIGENSNHTIGDSVTAYLPNSGEIIRTTFVGGVAYSQTNAGIFCSFLCTNPANKYTYATSRLCYIDCNNI